MALDYNAILDRFILTAREGLPTQLSTIGQNNDIPAVVRARQDGPKPSYPYVTLDVLDTREESAWLMLETLDPTGQFPQYETNRQVLLSYRVFGSNAIAIAQRLEGYFRSNIVRDTISTALGGKVVRTDPVEQDPILLADKYLESAYFNLIFNITDVYVDTAGSVFDTIHATGQVYNISLEDTDPQTIDVTVPIP